jgi:transporter family-2 protein
MPSASYAIVLSICLGFAGVMQAGMNRTIGLTWGLGAAVWLNAAIVFFTACLMGTAMLFRPELFPEVLRIRPEGAGGAVWWWVLPGIFGFCLIAGVPFAMSKIGSMNVFVLVVACQLIGSLVWDRVMESMPITPYRIAGALLAIIGAVVATLKR